MKKQVYLETTIVSYLTARPSRDLIQIARQEITAEWWRNRHEDFDLYVSQLVVDESSRGDRGAAGRRLEIVSAIPRLPVSDAAAELARALLDRQAIPEEATEDALHIAIASAHGMDFLLTWNCSHIANAEMLGAIQDVVHSCGCEPPVLCTPEVMMGDVDL